MENILDIVSNVCIFLMFGYIFYAMYVMNKQDRETGFIAKQPKKH
mgnify:CR=1 FL=1